MSEEIYPNEELSHEPEDAGAETPVTDASDAAEDAAPETADDCPAAPGRYERLTSETGGVRKLTGMYTN